MAAQFCKHCNMPACTCSVTAGKKIVFRACRLSDLANWEWSRLSYVGLKNWRSTDVTANFSKEGYTTKAISTSLNPLVAFIYACLAQSQDTVVFAIAIDNHASNAGSVQRQAAELQVSGQALKSAREQNEVALPSVDDSAILGYSHITKWQGFFQLAAWVPYSGEASLQNHAYELLVNAFIDYRRRCGGVVKMDNVLEEQQRLMGTLKAD